MPRKLVETVNSLKPSDFFDMYFKQENTNALALSQGQGTATAKLQVALTGTRDPGLAPDTSSLLDQCLQLVKTTSADDYRNSEIKWSLSKKRKEMLLPDMRYVILYTTGDKTPTDLTVVGFVSFMVTYEDGYEVIYCYEIHLSEAWQGNNIGKKLMNAVEEIGRRVGVEKAMLTVFKANERAVKMYQSLGYLKDEFSPSPRRLRNGTVKEPSYVILSKKLPRATPVEKG